MGLGLAVVMSSLTASRKVLRALSRSLGGFQVLLLLFVSLFFHLILIFCLHCQSFLRISGFTKICNKKITFQYKIFIVPEEGWFGQSKYSTHIKTFLRCAGFCLYSQNQ